MSQFNFEVVGRPTMVTGDHDILLRERVRISEHYAQVQSRWRESVEQLCVNAVRNLDLTCGSLGHILATIVAHTHQHPQLQPHIHISGADQGGGFAELRFHALGQIVHLDTLAGIEENSPWLAS